MSLVFSLCLLLAVIMAGCAPLADQDEPRSDPAALTELRTNRIGWDDLRGSAWRIGWDWTSGCEPERPADRTIRSTPEV